MIIPEPPADEPLLPPHETPMLPAAGESGKTEPPHVATLHAQGGHAATTNAAPDGKKDGEKDGDGKKKQGEDDGKQKEDDEKKKKEVEEKKKHDDEEMKKKNEPPPPPDKASLKRMWIVGILALLLLVGLFLIGVIPRMLRERRIKAEAAKASHAEREAHVVKVGRAGVLSDVVLPGTLQAYQSTPMYARSNGFIKEWKVDIGDPVKQGQLLAVVESPELEQQVQQAEHQLDVSRAAREQTIANLNLSRVTRDRWNNLVKEHAVSQQDADQKAADYEVQAANLKSADAQIRAQEANVAQLRQLRDYDYIKAPFDGIVTARGIDVGALITAGSNNATALFTVSQIDRLRLFVNVPEPEVPSIRVGMKAQLLVNEFPKRNFDGAVDRTANSIDMNSRTLSTEVIVENGPHTLLPGMYSLVTFHIRRESPPLMMPSAALVTRSEGTQAAVVRDGKVHFVNIMVGRDYGQTLEVTNGLEEGDVVVMDPTNNYHENDEVKAIEDKDVPGAQSQPAPATQPGLTTQKAGGAP